MASSLTSRERILRTVRGEPVDRVPIFSPVSWSPFWRISGEEPEWASDPNYVPVRKLCDEYCDSFAGAAGTGGVFDRRFLLVPTDFIEHMPEQVQGRRHRRLTVVHTPKGDLRTVEEWDEGVRTTWYTEPLVKTTKDAERILSVPYRFDKPDVSAFSEYRDKIGGSALTQLGVSTPLVCVSRLLQFEQFLEWCVAEFDLVDLLVRTVQERIHERLSWLLEQGIGPVVWFGGSEQATPPIMSPALYDALVVRYDKPLFDLVHKHGGIVHVHCHGKVSGILGKLVEMGADMLDPVEPPPQGDVEMGEAKRLVRGRITLMGNIEFCDLEFATPDEIEEKVKHAVLDGGKAHTILYPSATGHETVSERYRDNAIRYIEAGLKYGRF